MLVLWSGQATPHSSLRLMPPPSCLCCCCWPFTVLRRNFFLNSHAHLPLEQQMAPKNKLAAKLARPFEISQLQRH